MIDDALIQNYRLLSAAIVKDAILTKDVEFIKSDFFDELAHFCRFTQYTSTELISMIKGRTKGTIKRFFKDNFFKKPKPVITRELISIAAISYQTGESRARLKKLCRLLGIQIYKSKDDYGDIRKDQKDKLIKHLKK